MPCNKPSIRATRCCRSACPARSSAICACRLLCPALNSARKLLCPVLNSARKLLCPALKSARSPRPWLRIKPASTKPTPMMVQISFMFAALAADGWEFSTLAVVQHTKSCLDRPVPSLATEIPLN